MGYRWLLAVVLLAPQVGGCRLVEKSIRPSSFRNWSSDQAVVPYAEIEGDQVNVENIRSCRYLDEDVYVVDYEARSFSLSDVRTVDFLICPFPDTPFIAHTMLSFGIEDESGEPYHLVASVEIRREQGETYAAWKGSARQYELMYVLADEQDAIDLRVNHRGEDVYLYRSTATPEQARGLLVDILRRTNKLAREPEFYDTLTNNCTINIVRHINRLSPGRVLYDYRVLLPGHSDRLAYDLGLIERHGTFDDTKSRAHINDLARKHHGDLAFSRRIRSRL